VSRLQALWLSKRLDTDTDVQATALVNAELGQEALTKRMVDGWKSQEGFARAVEALHTDRARLWRALAVVYFAPAAWGAIGRLLTSDDHRAAKAGVEAYLKLAGIGDRSVSAEEGIDPHELAKDLVTPNQVQIVQVFRGVEPAPRTNVIDGTATEL